MYNPTMRLLTMLELLQSREEVSGQELAQKLEVDERSIRRYIMMLRDLGIPIEGERGRHGGYSLRAGFRLPPLMFNKDEITAVVLGLMLLQELGKDSIPAIDSAIAKIKRVLPDELRQSTTALHESLVMDNVTYGVDSIQNDFLTRLSRAVDNATCVIIRYESASGEETERMIAPYGIVLHGQRWYVPAFCYRRNAIRVFRMDRILDIAPTRQHFRQPDDFDARDYVLNSLARQSGTYTFEVLFDAPLRTVQEVIPPTLAILERTGKKTLMRCYSDDPSWLARFLAQIQLPYTILEPDELREAHQSLAEEILAKTKK